MGAPTLAYKRPSPGVFAVAAFLRRHDPAVAHWLPGTLLRWLRWHWQNGGVGIVGHRGQIVAVGVARCVRTLAEGRRDTYAHHEQAGMILWVDQLASIHPLGLPVLLTQARERFGPRGTVSGHVFKRSGELRMLPWSRVERILHHHGLA